MTATHTAATNTASTYGWVERAFHWSIALLIVTAIALGVVAYDWSYDTDAALATKATLFSAHKTVGIAIFFIALARIAWALSQPRPAPLHPDRKAETFAAAAVHWLLYGSLVLVPAFGWAHHATAEGFAPIWWPFGQSLPFLPKDPELSATLATLHMVFERVMVAALLLHILGTVKHSLIDKDSTFGRMWRGVDPGPLSGAKAHVAPVGVALVVWAGALGVGLALGPKTATAVPVQAAEVSGVSTWTVEEGTLSITVQQLGAAVTGSFSEWQAAIDFDETPRADGTHGTVEVGVSTASLSLGSVTQQATSGDFLASEAHPQATYTATLLSEGEGYVADGTLSVRGVDVPLRLPFTLELEGDRAVMAGTGTLDRRDFGMGESYPDESSVGFTVEVTVALTASRLE
ncbi:cytochrome b561 [Jannaschia pagri]|uniref:Cytochrome b561 n=1 Tax=Jannaschia pagri TaxID=2829797 RepID=A0ABQ4NMJ7_9RHOB|nr:MULTISPECIES: cytochrome b/b6 domain-containing protein [unclassified Jannaschia]GIT91800.1 cytochrome b561 [Jannaschia sp. AI_61]GIT95634.1 cytochrome b561 [Jannaschia sp. AI_62]